MKKLFQKLNFSDLLVFITGIAFVVSPLIVDFDSLPKGWELPKVYFWVIFSFLTVLIIWIYKTYKFLKNPDAKINYSYFGLLILLLILFLSTSLSEYGRIIFPDNNPNPLYQLIFNLKPETSNLSVSMSLYGNSFRDQGFITFLFIILFFWEIGKFVNKRNWHFVSIGFIASAIIQSIKAILEFNHYAKTDPDRLKEGMWVFGWFGQSNFYAGFILIAVIFSAYYLRSKSWTLRIIFIPCTIFLVSALCLSYSSWGIISVGLAIALIVAYEFLPKRFYPFFLALLGISFLVLYNWFITQIEKESALRVMIWDNAYEIFIKTPIKDPSAENARLLFLGSGFDTLGEVFRSKGRFEGLYIDRGHNFLVDIIVSSGVLGLTFFAGVLTKIAFRFKENFNNRMFSFTLIALVAWMFRSFVHENGIINIVQFFLLLSILASFSKKSS